MPCGRAKVAELDDPGVGVAEQQHVLDLQIAMSNGAGAVAVQVLNGVAELREKRENFALAKPPLPEQIVQRTAAAKLHHDNHLHLARSALVCARILQVRNVPVPQRSHQIHLVLNLPNLLRID